MFRKDDNLILQIVFNFENFSAFHFFFEVLLNGDFYKRKCESWISFPGSVWVDRFCSGVLRILFCVLKLFG